MKLKLSITKKIESTNRYGNFHETVECYSFDVTMWEDLPFPSMFVTIYDGKNSIAFVGVTFIEHISE